MPFRRLQRNHDISQYHRTIPVDNSNDLLKIMLSNGEVLYATLEGASTWKLDGELLPSNVSTKLNEFRGFDVTVARATVGLTLQLVVNCSYYRQNCEFTSTGSVTGFRSVKRTKRLARNDTTTGKFNTWTEPKY